MQDRAKLSKSKLLLLVAMSLGAIVSMATAPEGAVGNMFAQLAGRQVGALQLSEPKEIPPLAFLSEETKGKVVVVNFWALWCPTCKIEKPKLDRLQGDYANKGVVVLSVSDGGDSLDAVREYYSNHNITHLKPLRDEDSAAFRALELRGVPTTLILNREGKEIARAEGAVDWDSPEVRQIIIEGAL